MSIFERAVLGEMRIWISGPLPNVIGYFFYPLRSWIEQKSQGKNLSPFSLLPDFWIWGFLLPPLLWKFNHQLPYFSGLELGLNHTLEFSDSPTYRKQIEKLLCLHDNTSQFFIMSTFIIYCWTLTNIVSR